MNGRQAVNPFVPGRGHIPPYLAGREAEQGKLLDLFAYLQIGRRAPRDAVLSGPRGKGKTTLLRWFRREVEASGRDVDVMWLTPGEIPDLDRLELLAVAADVAGAFDGRTTLHSSELNAVIAEALPGEISTAEVLGCRDRPAMVGYVWKPPDAEAVWQPGIASLMTYIAGHGC